MGNMGTFNKPVQTIALDTEVAYHVGYLILCIMGLFMHPFFFSVLVINQYKAFSPKLSASLLYLRSYSTSSTERRPF